MANERYWDGKKECSKKAKFHTTEMESRYPDEIKEAYEKTKIQAADDNVSDYIYDMNAKEAEVILTPFDTVSAAFEYARDFEKPVILNFASYLNPGGKFLEGSCAQEECLCHESFLYNVLRKCDTYYMGNAQKKNKSLYTNRALYTENVIFEHAGEKHAFDVVTCAAPNYTAYSRFGGVSSKNLDALYSRMKFIRNIIEEHGCDCAILGAFGCGVFGQNPMAVAENWKKLFTTTDLDRIVYAVLGENTENFKAFRYVFEK